MFAEVKPSPVIYRSDPAPLPDDLSARQGHLAACETEQRELNRLRAALDGIGRQARLSGPDIARANGWADSAQIHLDRARRSIEAEEFEDMPAHAATIRLRMNLLRNFLVGAGALNRAEAAPLVGVTCEPAPAPACKHRVTPAQFLRCGIARIAHALKSVPHTVKRHMPSQIQGEKIGRMMERDLALIPAREELARLGQDLTLADLRRSQLMRSSGRAGQTSWARHTLGALLTEAQAAAAKGEQALKNGRHPQETVEGSIAAIRSRLTTFNTVLETGDQSGVNFQFLDRPWPTPSA